MSERKAVTKKLAVDYALAGRKRKTQILDSLTALTGWAVERAPVGKRLAPVLSVLVSADP